MQQQQQYLVGVVFRRKDTKKVFKTKKVKTRKVSFCCCLCVCMCVCGGLDFALKWFLACLRRRFRLCLSMFFCSDLKRQADVAVVVNAERRRFVLNVCVRLFAFLCCFDLNTDTSCVFSFCISCPSIRRLSLLFSFRLRVCAKTTKPSQ